MAGGAAGARVPAAGPDRGAIRRGSPGDLPPARRADRSRRRGCDQARRDRGQRRPQRRGRAPRGGCGGQLEAREDRLVRARPELGPDRRGRRATPACASTRSKVSISLNGQAVVVAGRGVPPARMARAAREMQEPVLRFAIDLGLGTGADRVLTCDLTDKYVSINAEYPTSRPGLVRPCARSVQLALRAQTARFAPAGTLRCGRPVPSRSAMRPPVTAPPPSVIRRGDQRVQMQGARRSGCRGGLVYAAGSREEATPQMGPFQRPSRQRGGWGVTEGRCAEPPLSPAR